MADQHGNNSQNVKDILGQTPSPQQGGGGGDGSGGSSSNAGGVSYISSPSMGGTVPSATNGPSDPSMLHNSHRATTPTSKQDPTQKDELGQAQEPFNTTTDQYLQQGPNELFFGADRSSGLCYKDREERVRQLRERQQTERQQKLEELKEQAASAQRFREQQEAARRLRLEDMRSKDSERRTQVEERKKIIQQAEQERRVAVLRKSAEREQRLEHKRRQERSNAVFAFGSSTPRMLDPKETISIQNYWGARRATSTTNVNMSDSGTGIRRSSECHESDLSRKRATSAHSLNRKPDDLRMSTSMYEVFNWDDGSLPPSKAPQEPPPSSSQGTRLTKSRDSSLERRFIPRGAASSEVPHKSVPSHASSSSSNSSEKTLVSSEQNQSRLSVWEFGDNFAALGKVGSGTPLTAASPSFSPHPPNPPNFSTAPATPTSTPHFSRRTPSVMTGAGCTFGGDDPMTRSLIATTSTAARRRTDLMPAVPSLRDTTSARGSPRHRSPGMAHSLSRLDQLSRPRQQRPNSLAPLHESPKRTKSMTPARTMSKSMSHLGPQRVHKSIGPATDGVGVPVVDGSLDRRSSRSSLALAHPRMTRAETLRLKLRGTAHTGDGFRSGTGTPNSPSRPTSALSQASGGSQVVLRNRTSPKKPRPLSIAGSTPSSADKPREPGSSIASPASPNRESRSIDRKSSTGNGPTKLVRAKSVSSDRSAPSTPAKTPSRGTTPKRTPAQVKAESAARKAAEKSKATLKLKSTPKTTPLQSPSVESKLLPGTDKKTVNNKSTPKEIAKPLKEPSSTDLKEDISKDNLTEAQPKDLETEVIESVVSTKEVETIIQEEISDISTIQVLDQNVTLEVKSEPVIEVSVESVVVEKVVETNIESEANVELEKSSVEVSNTTVEQVEPLQKATNGSTTAEDEEKAMVQRASEKPVTGYATEEEYKAALAEKRRKAREAKEREIELERQRQLEEEERERREEEEYLKLMEDQKKVEEERLKKAIEEAEKLRQEEILKKEEEEKQRIENERIELEKRKEAEEKARKEEEERLMRKSRVAQIMSRTRGSKGGNSPQSKIESKTPSDESKTMNDSLNAVNMSESFISSLSSSMTDSMIAQAIESRDSTQQKSPLSQQIETVVVDSVSECSSQPHSDLSSQPLSDVSSQANSSVELDYSQPSSGIHSDSSSMQSSIQITQEEAIVAQTNTEESMQVKELQSTPTPAVELLSNVEATPFQFENTFHLNGNSPITMETTTMIQNIDLLGSFNGVNGINHNGVETQLTKPDNDFGSLDPLNLQSSVTFTSKGEANFDQIIDINQTKLSNEDAVNSNNPPPPFIAFEDNLNRKQSQDSSNVPDLLL